MYFKYLRHREGDLNVKDFTGEILKGPNSSVALH